MAGDSIVIGSKFKPFSYAELLQPVAMATQAHQDIENQYSEFASKANVWENLANEQTDPQAYKMYKKYSDDLTKQAEVLAKEGLTPGSRQSMLQMKNRYSSEIAPLEQAFTRRRQLSDEQRKAMMQDPTMMFTKKADQTSLDELIQNPELGYQSYSGKLITAQVAQAASQLTKEFKENEKGWSRILGGQYYENIRRRGFKSDEILAAIQNNKNASPVLQKILDDAVQSTGITDSELLKKAYEYGSQGLWHAVGDAQPDRVTNRQWDLDNKPKDGGAEGGPPSRRTYRALGTVENTGIKTKPMVQNLEIIQKFKDKNGQFTEESIKKALAEYKEVNGSIQLTNALPGRRGQLRPTFATKKVFENNEVYERLKKQYGTTNFTELEQKIQQDIQKTAYLNQTFVTNFATDDWKTTWPNNLRIINADKDKSNAIDFETGKAIKTEDLQDIKIIGDAVLDINKDGFIVEYKDSKDKVKRMIYPFDALGNSGSIIKQGVDALRRAADQEITEEVEKDIIEIREGIFGTLDSENSSRAPGVSTTSTKSSPYISSGFPQAINNIQKRSKNG